MKTLQEITQFSIAKKIDTNPICRDILVQMNIPKILKRSIICELIKRLLFKCQLCGHSDGKMYYYLHREHSIIGVNETKKYCSLCYSCYKQGENERINRGSLTYITLCSLDEMVTKKNFSKFIACQYCAQNYIRLIDNFHWYCFRCHRINIWLQLIRNNHTIFEYTQDPNLTRPLYQITINAVFDDDRFEKIESIRTNEPLYILFRLHMTRHYRENIIYIINGSKFHDVSEDILTINDILPHGVKNRSELTLYDEDDDIIEIIFNVKILTLKKD